MPASISDAICGLCKFKNLLNLNFNKIMMMMMMMMVMMMMMISEATQKNGFYHLQNYQVGKKQARWILSKATCMIVSY